MSATLLAPPIASDGPPRKRFTRAEVEQLMDAGFFTGQRYELIDGDLIQKMGQNPPHASAIRNVLELLAGIFGLRRVQVQLPMEVAIADQKFSMPEPDLAVLRHDSPEFRQRHPRGDELALIIEVADTTVRHDATTKRDLYARAGVTEYWILDVNARKLIVHRQLSAGSYGLITTVEATSSIASDAQPDAQIPVAQMLP